MSQVRQEVDLYLPHLRPSVDWLSPVNSLLIVVAATLLMSLLALLTWQGNQKLQDDIAALTQKKPGYPNSD
ncbi:MAG: hypothetical protein AseanaTS_16890 [Candidatus Pelagadaptatus aseana]|uniref:hypothetical protein n=1 Tax=Candidatus Pelagadaptatus aseana TaxID=3120508 RepID=UPI0039B1C578